MSDNLKTIVQRALFFPKKKNPQKTVATKETVKNLKGNL